MRHNKTLMWVVALAMTVFLAACVESTPSAPPPVSDSPTVTIKDMRFEAGTYPYVCTLHSGMKGTVTVVDA